MNILKKLKSAARRSLSVVVVAAGSSTRMGEDKLFVELEGKPILVHTLSALSRFDAVDEIVVVTRADRLQDVAVLCDQYGLDKVTKVLIGGATRVESALVGVSEVNPNAGLIAIHDGARPFVTEKIMNAVVNRAQLCQAAAPAVPVRDTIKLCEHDCVAATPPREQVRAVQTPQVFHATLIKGALTNAVEKELSITDDCSAVEALGIPVHLTEGDPDNIKITMPIDLKIAEIILRHRGEEA